MYQLTYIFTSYMHQRSAVRDPAVVERQAVNTRRVIDDIEVTKGQLYRMLSGID